MSWMSITKAAQVTGVNRGTIQSMVAAKRIKVKKIKRPRREGARGPVSPLRVNPAQVKRALMRRQKVKVPVHKVGGYVGAKHQEDLISDYLAGKTLMAMGRMLIAVAGA